MPEIALLDGREILDSRGRPTVQARCVLSDGSTGVASVPSGASTGRAEAHELRDGDRRRYRGLGCRKAVALIRGELAAALHGHAFVSQAAFDRTLIELDGTAQKTRLGANTLLALSLAFARACAVQCRQPLYRYFGQLLEPPLVPCTLPRPTINLFSGGKHAGGQIPIQDLLLVPVAADTIDDCLALTAEVYQAAITLIRERYGMRPLSADEGGLAPPFAGAEAMLGDAIAAIRLAGLEPGRDVALALDIAASHFFQDGRYHLDGQVLDSAGMIAQLADWLARFPIVSLEDGLAEDDWAHWPELRQRVAGRALVLGDDLLCTNPGRIRRALDSAAADALLLKVNQIGTLSEAATACQLARAAGWMVTVSARSGETEDDWLADLAVGWGGDQIKVGSITQSERLAKYNRLLAIEADTGFPLVAWPRSEALQPGP